MKDPQLKLRIPVRGWTPVFRAVCTAIFAAATMVAAILAAPTVSEGAQIVLDEDLNRVQVMNQLLVEARNMDLDAIRAEPVELVTDLSFDPVAARNFDQIRTKLKLTGEELQLYRQNGFVSIDHDQLTSFGSAYYQIYSAHLPVFVSSDSILHALHRSFDDVLAELERTVIFPRLESILASTHDSLVPEKRTPDLHENFNDVDLYLSVARNLLAQQSNRQQEHDPASYTIPSKFDQDDKVLAILKSIDAGQIQVPGLSETRIYGGVRPIDFSQFAPRGHYTKHPKLSSYFRCMMWLSRADCGWFIRPVDPITKIENDPFRELKNAALLTLSLQDAGQQTQFESMNRLLSHFASQDDSLSATKLGELLRGNGIQGIADLDDQDRLTKVFQQVGNEGAGTQLIRSQAMFVDGVSYTVKPPSLFQLFGQKFAIDSFVMSNVVYDSIVYKNRKVKRFIPKGLDVMAALGNSEALRLLEPEIQKYKYATNLFALSRFVESCTAEFWQRDLYNTWIDSIRELDKDVANDQNVPEAMKTVAWQRKQLQTQLAAWSELRHDMVLYAKQSYAGTPGCEYPDGYVEPYPEFFNKLQGFAKGLRAAMLDFHESEPVADLESLTPFQKRLATEAGRSHVDRIRYTSRLIDVLEKLEAIARTKLRGESMTEQQIQFLQQTIDRRGSLPLGSGSQPRYDGWYCDLFYKRSEVRKWDPTVIDVHTFPDPVGQPEVLEVGVGNVNLGVIAVDCEGTANAYVGPLYSYYEFHQPANQRLTDQDWSNRVAGKDLSLNLYIPGEPKQKKSIPALPKRPGWTNVFQAPAKKRTIDLAAAYVYRQKIHLKYTANNEKPTTETFPADDQGVAAFVDFVNQHDFSERWSLDLNPSEITPKALDAFEGLENLAFVSLPWSLDPGKVEEFRLSRPDVEVRPASMQIVRGEICDSVQGYRAFVAKSNPSVAPGETFPVYVELSGLHTSLGFMGSPYSTNVNILAQVVDDQGRTLHEQTFIDLQELTSGMPRCFYRAPEITLADYISPGSYQLVLQIVDQVNKNKPTVSASLPLVVVRPKAP